MKIIVSSDIQLIPHKPVTYAHYLKEMEKLVSEKRTSGEDQSEEKVAATALNLQRMQRITKTVLVDPSLSEKIKQLKHPLIWLILTEAWCGDAAQNIPVINEIVTQSKGKIQLLLVLRDENKELMDHYLTNGAKSIPKLLCIDALSGEVTNTWGSRPLPIQNALKTYKTAFPKASHQEIIYNLHLTYSKDKGKSLQQELFSMIERCGLKDRKTEVDHNF